MGQVSQGRKAGGSALQAGVVSQLVAVLSLLIPLSSVCSFNQLLISTRPAPPHIGIGATSLLLCPGSPRQWHVPAWEVAQVQGQLLLTLCRFIKLFKSHIDVALGGMLWWRAWQFLDDLRGLFQPKQFSDYS